MPRSARNIAWDPPAAVWSRWNSRCVNDPMQEKGEERMLKMLLPGRYELATAQMRCVGTAAVPLLDGELKELIEINCEIQAEEGPIDFLNHLDG